MQPSAFQTVANTTDLDASVRGLPCSTSSHGVVRREIVDLITVGSTKLLPHTLSSVGFRDKGPKRPAKLLVWRYLRTAPDVQKSCKVCAPCPCIAVELFRHRLIGIA